MRKAKRLIALLLTAAMLTATPTVALAAGGEVPTKGAYFYKENGKWVKSADYTWSYKGDGRLTKRTEKTSYGESYSTSFKWKGNFITKITYSDKSYTTYKYKGSKRQSFKRSGNNPTVKYKWKKNTATFKADYGTVTLKFNSKGQLTSEKEVLSDETYTYTYKYYSNGNRKSTTGKSNKGYSFTEKYNSKGYLTSSKGKSGSYTWNSTYKYKTKNGKVKEGICTNKSSDGNFESKMVYSKWKKVSRVRNCDGFGLCFGLG